MGLIHEIREGQYTPDDGPPLVTPGRLRSLHETAERIRQGEDVLFAVLEFLDHAGRATPGELLGMIEQRPATTGSSRADALLGGLGEHFAITRDLPSPVWTGEPDRFLDRFWFVSDVEGFRAISIAQSPVALKRRGVMWPARSLERV